MYLYIFISTHHTLYGQFFFTVQVQKKYRTGSYMYKQLKNYIHIAIALQRWKKVYGKAYVQKIKRLDEIK